MSALFTKAYGTAVILTHRIGQGRVPYLPLDRLCEKRDRRVRRMVRYAATTVPYYRDLFRELGIDPSEVRTAADLDRLPLLDKALVRADPCRFVSTSRWGRTALRMVTSGTTGEPLTVFHDRHSLLVDSALIRRQAGVVQDVLGRRADIRGLLIKYQGGSFDARQAFLHQARFGRQGRARPELLISDPLNKVVDALNRYRPDLLLCGGSYAEALFRYLAAKNIDVHVPRVVLYGADSITDSGKALIQRQFGAVLLSTYETVEVHKIGFSCQQGTGFHLHIDLTDLKIVDDRGRRLPPGQKGEVVVSNLVNRGTVLLNYRLGDLAALSEQICPCGRSLPLLTELEGRVEDVIHLPGGAFLHPRLVWRALKHQQGLLRYQLVQTAPNVFQLRLQTIDWPAFQRIAAQATAELRPVLGSSAVIEPVCCESLEAAEGGKFKPVMALATDGEGREEKR